jgi:hypothetical protein
MADQGIRLQLLLGSSLKPASYDVMDALVDVEVRNNDRERDGLQLTFQLGRGRTARDFALSADGALDPPGKICIAVIIQGQRYVLINGLITEQQSQPSNQPGGSRLIVTGEDLGLNMDQHEKSVVNRNMPDSSIVATILGNYSDLTPDIRTTSDTPAEVRRVVTQQATDLAFVRELASRNNFVFCTEPTSTPGRSVAYWGPKERKGEPAQPALNMNMGSFTNVDQLSFQFQALKPVTPKARIIEPLTGMTLEVPAPNLLSPGFASNPAKPLRSTIQRDTANMDMLQAGLKCLSAAAAGANAVEGTGELDTARYGYVLRSRHTVNVRGAGVANDGKYYVKQVTHRIRRGEYKQSFSLEREGRGATKARIR